MERNHERFFHVTEWPVDDIYDFDGRPVRYGVTGSGRPLVVVHGTPWSSYNLRHLIRGLSDDFTVFYYDMVGYGESDKRPGDVSLGVQNELLARLVAHWGLSSPYAVGHDFGGATVLRGMLLNGLKFAGVALIDPVALSPWGSPFFRHVKRHEDAFSGLPDYIHEAVVRAYVGDAGHVPLAPEVLARTVRPWLSVDGKGAFYRQIAQADSRYTRQVEPLYRDVNVPVLILWGEDDTWIPIERGRTLAGMVPDAEFYSIPDAGHLVIEERPDALLARLAAFFTRSS